MSAGAFFIVSSGRSGTAMLHKALSAEPDIEMHHEYMVHIVQPLGVKRYLGLADHAMALRLLTETHGAAIRLCDRRLWGDSSNKLSWLIPELAVLFPQARFVHLVRDGRKVASSYFHKLGDESYDDRSNAVMQNFVDGRGPMPPPEKKFWWPVPQPGDARAAAFRRYDRFERIAWHWVEINRVISESLQMLAAERTLFVRLEDLVSLPSGVRALYDFLGLRFSDSRFAPFLKPHNVNRPEDHLLDASQRARFDAIASGAMARYGYADREEYVVNY